MKKKILFPLVMLPALLLTACNGWFKVDFETFKKEVNNIKEKDFIQMKVKGTVEGRKYDFTVTNGDTSGLPLVEKLEYVLLAGMNVKSYAIYEDEDLNYYTFIGFKVEDKEEKYCYQFDDRGHVTKFIDYENGSKTSDLTISYRY